jgi:hypothetical protein
MDKEIFGISPELMKQAKKVGEHLELEINKYRGERKIEVRYILTSPCSSLDAGILLDKLADQLVWGHATAFGMKGTINDVEQTKV